MPVIQNPDVVIQNEGSIILFQPCTDAAKEWVEEHIPDEAQWFGPSFVVEWRFADDIIAGMQDDGLVVV